MVKIKEFFDTETATLSYVVADEATGLAAVIDPVLNYDHFSGLVTTVSADQIIDYLSSHQLKLEWLLETHIHADHLTASRYIKQKLGGRIAIGSKIRAVLERWVPFFNNAHDTPLDARQFDALLDEGQALPLGKTTIRVIHTPGHTPSCVSYVIGDNVFVGDALFMPDVGTGRADFPGGNAGLQYDSLQKILSLPDETSIFSGHDYPTAGRTATGKSTVREQKEKNILIKAGVSKQDYVAVRNARDHGKPNPKLLYPSIQVNLRAGDFGHAEPNRLQFIKTPIEFKKP